MTTATESPPPTGAALVYTADRGWHLHPAAPLLDLIGDPTMSPTNRLPRERIVQYLHDGKPISWIVNASGWDAAMIHAVAKDIGLANGPSAVTTAATPIRIAPADTSTTADAGKIVCPHDKLLEWAAKASAAPVRTAARRAQDALARLQQVCAEQEEAENERRRQEMAKTALRAEVAQLEAKLAAAKAKLKGKPAPVSAGSETAIASGGKPKRQYTPEGLAKVQANAARMRERRAEQRAAQASA